MTSIQLHIQLYTLTVAALTISNLFILPWPVTLKSILLLLRVRLLQQCGLLLSVAAPRGPAPYKSPSHLRLPLPTPWQRQGPQEQPCGGRGSGQLLRAAV